MKNNKLLTLSIAVLTIVASLFFQSCADSDKGIYDIIIEDENTEIAEASLNLVSKDWGASIESIKSRQPKGLYLKQEDSEFLGYVNKKGTFRISYDFLDDNLRSSLLLIPVSGKSDAGRYSLGGYDYLGNIDGASLYVSADGTTLASVIDKTFDGEEYLAIGFTPLESDLFEAIDPITVATNDAENITNTSVTVSGSFTGFAENPSAAICYSTNADMSDSKKYKCSINNGRFERTITGLPYNSTVYYKAIVTDEGIAYEGDVKSAQVEPLKTYSIGDPYPDNTNPIGVVCSIKNSGTSGTVVSLDEKVMQWDKRGNFCTYYGCSSTTNGARNNMGSVNPYAKWVRDHGADWYGPARSQLIFSKGNLTKINKSLRSLGYMGISGIYWSSSERDANNAWAVVVTETTNSGYDNGVYFYNSKDQSRWCRAMKDF